MKRIVLVGYVGDGTVKKTKDGDYDVIIRIPFITKEGAENALEEIVKVKRDDLSP